MPIGRVIRHSPLYIYLKMYGLTVLVSLFASRPITGRLLDPPTLRRIQRIRVAAEEAVLRRRDAQGRALLGPAAKGRHIVRALSTADKAASNDGGHPYPYALKTLAVDADSRFPAESQRGASQRLIRVVRRWGRRLRDLSMVKRTVIADGQDLKRYPEMALQAHVRCSSSRHTAEATFIQARAQRIATDSALLSRLGITRSPTEVHPDDVPRVALSGSGGGYRASFGFLASLQGLHEARVYDGAFWMAGVSGSCWTIAGLYTVAHGQPDALLRHVKRVAAEGLHPMSRGALDVVARSSQGVYFLLAPLLAKLRGGNVGIGIMDMYATLTTTYQLLSRSPHARPRLSRSTFEFSRVWQRSGLAKGLAPMPIMTAVRVLQAGVAQSSTEQDSATLAAPPPRATRFQWWEMNPLEVGSSDEAAWVPTWSYGRSFVSGRSVSTAPEISLSLLLGQATSAPAGPLTGYISAMLATLPHGTIMSRLLAALNDFVRHKRWERRWGNPIRGAHEPNPLYGFGSRSQEDQRGWEGRGRLKLMDSGMSNNLPNHIFTSAARRADIIVAFDQSSDVQTGAGWARLNDFAKERNVVLEPEERQSEGHMESALSDIEVRFRGKYAQVFRAWNVQGGGDDACGLRVRGVDDEATPMPTTAPDFYLIYCPLLPNACQPDFDPVTSTFSTSYNLVWAPEEIDTIARTAKANTMQYVVPALKCAYMRVYEEKRRHRLIATR